MRLVLLSLLLLLGISNTNFFSQGAIDSAQKSIKYYLVIKNNGKEYYGYLVKDDGREILLETKSLGKIYINKSDVKEMREVKETSKDSNATSYSDFRDEGPFTTRYYFTTNALPIKKKENYLLVHPYGPEVHFAVSDNLSLGVMSTWIATPLAFAAKYSFTNSNPNSDVHFALGGIIGSGGYLAPQTFGGLYFGAITKGNRMANMSFSVGFAHINLEKELSSFSKQSFQTDDPNQDYYVPLEYFYGIERDFLRVNKGSMVFGVSGIKAVGKKVSFIFDSMLFLTRNKSIDYQNDVTLTFSNTSNFDDIPPTQDFVVGEGTTFRNEPGFQPTIILMPGMRFSRKYGSAFQVVLSGIIFKDSDSGDYRGIPIPQVSWLKAF